MFSHPFSIMKPVVQALNFRTFSLFVDDYRIPVFIMPVENHLESILLYLELLFRGSMYVKNITTVP